METKISLKSIIQLDKVEDLLSSLINQVEAQQKTILNLQNLSNTHVTKETFNQYLNNLDSTIHSIHSKLDLLNDASTSKMGNNVTLPAGELSYINSVQIEQIMQSLQTYTTTKDINNTIENVINKFQDDINHISNNYAPITITNKLYQASTDISKRIYNIENTLLQKVDVSNLERIETLAAKLDTYENFRDIINNEIIHIKEELNTNSNNIYNNSNNIHDISQHITHISSDIKLCASRVDLRALAKVSDSHSKLLNTCVDKHTVDTVNTIYTISSHYINYIHTIITIYYCIHIHIQLKQQVGQLGTDLIASQTGIDSLLERTNTLQTEIKEKFSTEALKKFVLRHHFDDVITALGTAIDLKSDKNLTDQLVQRVNVRNYVYYTCNSYAYN